MSHGFFQQLARRKPALKDDLRRAHLIYKPEEFVKKTFLSALYMSLGIALFAGMLLSKFGKLTPLFLIAIPLLFFWFYSYLLKVPFVALRKQEKGIGKEIVFAGRHLIIELESGIPLYNALINVSANYEYLGKYFRDVINNVNLGTALEDALSQAVEDAPSEQFRRIIWQILNSIRTGSEVTASLSLVVEQIAREQSIEMNNYSKKLNPLAMFYMVIAVIMPSLGVTMLIVLSSFIELQVSLTTLLVIAFMIAFIQFMFLSMIRFSRPALEF